MSNFPEKIKIGVTHSLVFGMCTVHVSAVVTFGKLDTSFFMEKSSTGTRVKYIESPF